MTDLVSFVSGAGYNIGGDALSQANLSQNFDTFINILTAQIQNQDPLEPTDSSKFTEQLVQFSGVEQQIRSNKLLEAVFNATIGNAGAALSGYLGQTAEINTSGAQLTEGATIDWRYTLPETASSVSVTVTDAKGQVLWSETGETTAGAHDFSWDGRLFNGQTADQGVYYINVVARDLQDNKIDAAYSLKALINGIDLTHGEPAITTTAGIFGYSDILRLMQQ